MSTAVLENKAGIPESFMEYRVSIIEKKLEDVTQDVREVRIHITNLDLKLSSRMEQLDSKLNSRIDKLDSKIDQLESKFGSRMDKLEDRLWVLLIGVAFSILVPILLKFL